MRKKEQRLWDRFRANIHSNIRMHRVENAVETGMPDVIAISAGRVTWVELKAVEELPARAMTPVLGEGDGLTVEQRNWILDWVRYGGLAHVLVGIGSEQLLIPGNFAGSVNEATFTGLSCAAVASTWEEIASVLREGERRGN